MFFFLAKCRYFVEDINHQKAFVSTLKSGFLATDFFFPTKVDLFDPIKTNQRRWPRRGSTPPKPKVWPLKRRGMAESDVLTVEVLLGDFNVFFFFLMSCQVLGIFKDLEERSNETNKAVELVEHLAQARRPR